MQETMAMWPGWTWGDLGAPRQGVDQAVGYMRIKLKKKRLNPGEGAAERQECSG